MRAMRFLPSSLISVGVEDDLEIVVERLYRRHVTGACIRAGASLLMWLLAIPSYLTGYLTPDSLWGISVTVAYLVLMNPPLLLIARRLTSRRAFDIFSIIVNSLEILGYTAAIHFVGGLDAAYLLPMYCALIAYVGMLSPIRLTIFVGLLCLVFLDGMVLLEHYGILVNYTSDILKTGVFSLSLGAKLAILAAVNGLVFEVTLICARIGGKLREHRLQIRRQNQALMKAGEELERKVAERTSELEQSNENLRKEIEERRRAEQERSALQTQLRQAQKMQAVGTLASGIAHDFNNILHALSGYLHLLEKGQDPARSAKYFSEMEGVVTRGVDLVQRLMAFGHQTEPVLQSINLPEQINQILKILIHTIPKMIEIKTSWPVGVKPIMADPGQIERIIMNLCTNARDAMPEGGTIFIELENRYLDQQTLETLPDCRPGDYVKWTVSDTGQGMDETTLQRIFEPFFTTKEVGRGTGLGMFTVYRIVKSLRGHITCQSEPGRGTIFHVYLPAGEAEVEDGMQTTPHTVVQDLRGTETIMLVDDERSVLEIGEEVLSDFGYTVVTETCGENALQRLQDFDQHIDLIILDLGMPGMGGRACLEGILTQNAAMKVIIASGYSQASHVKDVIGAGAKAFIPKPYRLTDMLVKIREVLAEDGNGKSLRAPETLLPAPGRGKGYRWDE